MHRERLPGALIGQRHATRDNKCTGSDYQAPSSDRDTPRGTTNAARGTDSGDMEIVLRLFALFEVMQYDFHRYCLASLGVCPSNP